VGFSWASLGKGQEKFTVPGKGGTRPALTGGGASQKRCVCVISCAGQLIATFEPSLRGHNTPVDHVDPNCTLFNFLLPP